MTDQPTLVLIERVDRGNADPAAYRMRTSCCRMEVTHSSWVIASVWRHLGGYVHMYCACGLGMGRFLAPKVGAWPAVTVTP